jgi:hypothetical protein
MLKITSNYLTKLNSNYSAHLTRVDTGSNSYFATLATINFGGSQQLTFDNSYGTEIDVPGTAYINAVVANGQLLTPALDPTNPVDSEYIFNPYTGKITVYSTASSVLVFGSPQQINYLPSIVTGLPALFYLLPIEGVIQISRSFENHPQASFGFSSHYSRDQIAAVFAPGREVSIYGMAFRVGNCNTKESSRAIYPDGRVTASVSFTGKWENYLNDPCFLRSDGQNTIPKNEPFTDTECLVGTSVDNNSSISLATLFSRISIPLIGRRLKPVPVPLGTARDAIVNHEQLLQERLRVGNSFVRYSNDQGIEIIDINGLASHFIPESEITEDGVDTSYEAIDKTSKQPLTATSFNQPEFDLTNFPSTITQPSPNITAELQTNLGFEYPVVELSGEFSEPKEPKQETSQGQTPRYVRRPVERKTRIEGNPNANIPPVGVFNIQVMSLCFDLGGEQQTRTFVTEENGATIRTVEEIWGFAFTAEDIYNSSTGKYSGDPATYWKLLKQVATDYIYDTSLSSDGGTGYLLYRIGTGFNTVRWKSENSSSPETLEVVGEASVDATKLRGLYTFFQIPITERYSRKLKLQPEYSTEGLFELVKVCNRDGTSSYKPLINPDYAPPYYVEHERTEKVSFKSRSNPENELLKPPGDVLQPDLYVGSVEIYESIITGITPARYVETYAVENGVVVTKRGEQLEPQKWYRYNYKYSASGQAITTAVEEAFTESGEGDLPQAQERITRYTREEPEQSKEDQLEKNEQQYKYLIWTEGYSQNDPINGSEYFSLAETFDEALTAAKCKAAIENWRNGYSETLTTRFRQEIKEGDRVNYFCNGQYRSRVAISVNHSLSVIGNIDGESKVNGLTTLQLGKYVRPSVYFTKIALPSTKTGERYNISVLNVVNDELGNLLDWSTIKSRRNP